jgi:hypothetical protein
VKPTSSATIVMSRTWNTIATVSAAVRPASTAERAIGNDLNRSMSPFWRSSASPTPVCRALKIAVWTKIPGIR